ncbi:Uncharacterised protein [Legionella steigerwaltii]|uniref:Uncharacterized protein n=1 Tax=Legionella steigerwaltii TaxID=460 RepID=A0A378PH03_9GAMM|nr:Uncharacterised protein [Legionella steigerwaltii]
MLLGLEISTFVMVSSYFNSKSGINPELIKVAVPCASKSSSKTFNPSIAIFLPKSTVVSVFPTPPFKLETAIVKHLEPFGRI